MSSTASSPASGRDNATACARRAPTTRATAIASTRTSCWSTRTPPCSTARSRCMSRSSARSPTGRRAATRDSAPFVPKAVAVPAFAKAPARGSGTPWSDTIVYELHVRGYTKIASRGARGDARHLRRPRAPGGHRAPRAPRRHHGRADADRRLGRRTPPGTPGTHQLLGLQPGRAHGAGPAAGSGRHGRTRGLCRRAARSRHRSAAGRRPQPHGRRRRARADAEPARPGQRHLLPHPARRPRALRQRCGMRQHAGARPRAGAAPRHGHAAPLRAGRRRRRLPLRPRHHPRPPRPWLRSRGAAAAGHRAGSRAAELEARGGALGHRPRRPSAWGVSRRLGRMERPLPRYGAPLLAWRRRDDGRARHAPRRLGGHLRAPLAPALALGQLRVRPRRLHPGRPRLVHAQAQRGQRRGQSRRHRRQPVVEPRSRGRDGRCRRRSREEARHARTPRHAVRLARHADAGDGRRAGPQPAGQQQRLRAGQRARLGRLEPRRRRTRRLRRELWPPCATRIARCVPIAGSRASRSMPAAFPTWNGGIPMAVR